MIMKKRIVIIGGGTFSYIRTHLALAAPAFGETAKQLQSMFKDQFEHMDVELVLTKMADSNSKIITNEDLSAFVDTLLTDNSVKVIIFNAAVCDFDGSIGNKPSGKYEPRMLTAGGTANMHLTPTVKIINKIRKNRKDIFLVAFKSTCDATPEQQFEQGLKLLKSNSANLVVANDVSTRHHMIITPEEGVYTGSFNDGNRKSVLLEMVEMVYHRTHLSFTRSTVVNGFPVPWNNEAIFPSLRTVINWCVSGNAYKAFNGVTTGHFAAKIGPNKFLTSIRKTNFNNIEQNGLVIIETDGEDNVIAYGAKPSVGGQSQRKIFSQFPDIDCIVHFHCPLLSNPADKIPVVSQFEFECGSHECGQNTADGLKMFDNNIYAVMLENHGPNIVFPHTIDPQLVIDFISRNFNLSGSTSGFEQVYFNPH